MCVKETYGCQIGYLRNVVSGERLVLYGVLDGWGPLCQALGIDVPDEPFPKANDGEAIEELFRRMVVQGLLRWVWVGGFVDGGWGLGDLSQIMKML